MTEKSYTEKYQADLLIENLKTLEKRTEENQRELSEILRRDPSPENFIKVYSIVESLHLKEGEGKKIFKTDYRNDPYIDYICSKMKPNSTILEVGCGDGQLCNIFSEKGHNVLGIDSARECISIADGHKDIGGNLKCAFEMFDCRNLKDIKSEYFDYMVSNHVIEHLGLSGFISHLEHASRILKKQGKYFITCPSALRSANEGDLHIKIFYYSELIQIAKMLGFNIELIIGFKGRYITLPSYFNLFVSAYEQFLRLTRLNLLFNYFDIYVLCVPISVILTKIDSNMERIERRKKITEMQRRGWYR